MKVLEEYERQFLAQLGKILLDHGEKKQDRKCEEPTVRTKPAKSKSA